MRHHMPACSGSAAANLTTGECNRSQARSNARLLAAGASLLVLGVLDPASAEAANIPGVWQHAEDVIAINLFEVGEGEPPPNSGANETDINAGGNALAEAIVSCAESATCAFPGAVFQYAHGSQSAANNIIVDGSLSIGAQAHAEGAAATAAGVIQIGLWQVAAAEDAAQNEIAIGGIVDVLASANAIATTGSAVAFAGIGAGISQIATSIGIDGVAANLFENDGELAIAAEAVAGADLGDAAASAFIGVGVYQEANGQESAAADLSNSGSMQVEASASAVAGNGIAVASASAAGIVQFADARTQQFASTLTSGGLLIGVTSNTPSGPSSATLSNTGSIAVDVNAAALGGSDAAATGAVLGVGQFVSGSDASAIIDNSGSIAISASVDVESSGTPRGVVFVSGISQAATAFDFSTVETIDQGGVLTYQISSTPVGPAVASFVNSGDVAVAGQVDVVALGTSSMAEGLGVAFVDGFDQYANGDGASASIENSGNFTVSADVTVDSGNVSNAVAIATGIDQFATAYASHATIVFANGTTTPSTYTGGATAIGSAVASFDNIGSLTVVANVDTHGDAIAFGGATASAIGQSAAGTEASASIDNSGSIISIGSLSSSGHAAFGGAAAIGVQQGAQGTALADVQFDNGGTLAVLASAVAFGESGAFVNATAFGAAQNVQADEVASAHVANAGTMDIRAIGSAVAEDTGAFDMAIAFAAAHGLGQLAQGAQALVHFENSGSFQLLAEVDASAGDFALASGTASGAIQQIALGSASGTASASIDNSGTILVAAIADAAAGSTALALAGVRSAIGQLVIAGEGGSASITNSGSINLVADAEALAAGGDVTDVASAQAYVLGINAAVSATGISGVADVDLANDGTIDITAVAHATGSGLAQALATAVSGLVGSAHVAFDGSAAVSLTNDGELTLVGAAEATGGYTAHATGIAVAGMDASAIGAGVGDATASIANSGSVMLGANAHANAGTNALAVAIAIDGLQATAHAGIGDAVAEISNSGELEMIANATASALNAQAFAIVGGTFFTGAIFQSAAAMNGDASAIAENSGSISVVADALANGEVIASASAVGGPGVNQFAFATSGDASASFDNSGSLEFIAHADANATNSAYADAVFYNAVAQFANANGGVGMANLQLTNDGSISLAVVADASGDAAAGALAIASHEVGQSALVIGNDATLELTNSGSIDMDVASIAAGANVWATAVLATAIHQSAAAIGDGGAEVSLDNSGSIDLAVLASAESPAGSAAAVAALDGAVTQYAGAGSSQYVFGTTSGGLTSITQNIFPTGPAILAMENSGTVDVAVAAIAEGGSAAGAEATGFAVNQFARGTEANASFANDGSIDISLGATAKAEQSATASGNLTAFIQAAAAVETTIQITATGGGGQLTDVATNPVGSALVSFSNSGAIDIVGIASAEADDGTATASMVVHGVEQSVFAADAQAFLSNDGEFVVGARAEATADAAATAHASALGFKVSGGDFEIAVDNGGEFSVIAEASADAASGLAVAHAQGMTVSADGFLTGEIDNSGDFLVAAVAGGPLDATALATGLDIVAGSADFSISNSGSIVVSAEASAGFAEAVGIRVTDNGGIGFDAASDIVITNDGGSIIVRQSNDGGETWLRGTAIDTSAAPSRAVLNLVGDGSIYGNIDVAAGDIINVGGGETWFDGIINPECQLGACGQGTLNIGSGGALFLRHDGAGSDGPSAAFVEQLNIASDGTLIFELPVGTDPEASYPRITATVANLDGTLLVRSASGLYADHYLFEDVIDADVRNGQFDSCGIEGNPVLLQLSCVYDTQGNVDLGLTRVAFNAVNGLTRNQKAVGSGIEAIYDADIDGPFGDMVAQLFTFDEDEYRGALDQLSGAGYAAYQQSFHALGVHYGQLIDKATECAMPQRASSALDCRTDKFHIWGQLDVGGRRNDGDVEAPGYDADRWAAIVGADVRIGDNAVAGASIGKVTNHVDHHDGASTNADGYQFGAYASFDPGAYYAKAIATVSQFDGDGRRSVNWGEYGADLAGQLEGDPDVRLTTLGLHAGYRIQLGKASLLTPYLNVDYSGVRLKDFTESGLAAADLSVDGSKSSRTTLAIGSKWAADLGAVIPQAELGYLHFFGDRRSSFDAAFLDDRDGSFEVVSASEKRGSLLAGISLGGRAGGVNVRVGYQGLFNGDGATHNATFRIIMPFGGN
ncbi:autotransporter outer membrane beta-barrel domain-containing protein [Sphingomonas sp. G124]|uniref:Autotransporter outer membrane beta-barrel domain-containing protein n=1 Tax=Sphingomonas cremea TaxID=2904799 RepID=A0A9X1QM59_9SPHN|nr:autotransporter outer membrane beta-barrel domain-containing protein [Sphingomonas cremea]MCF2515925.1 autotransporter outer membrane beta-barrel domain-containing protein [Sphingomonas cremea]